jgi:hypothetical protein
MTPSEVLAELHEGIQRQKRLLRRLRLLEAARIAELADQLSDQQWRDLDADAEE